MIIALIIIGYFILGFGCAMGFAFLDKRTGTWDYNSSGYCAAIIFFYPIILPCLLIALGLGKITDFFNWFAEHIKEKDAE